MARTRWDYGLSIDSNGEGVYDQRLTGTQILQHEPIIEMTRVSLGQMPLSMLSWHYVNAPGNTEATQILNRLSFLKVRCH